MTDFISDGQPFETPPDAAAEGYAATPPSFGRAFGALFQKSSMLSPEGETSLPRFTEISEYGGLHGENTFGSKLGRALAVAGETGGAPIVLPPSVQSQLPGMGVTPAPMEDAASVNARAPLGPDGKPVHITDAPMPKPVADLVLKAKSDEIERDGVISRFENAHSLPVTFATGTAAFLLDPLNAASAFVPGLGEDVVAARLGGGFLARTAGRVVAGATGGAISQAPLTALRYGLGREEAADYSLRDAFRDMAFSAAGGALMQAGIGTAGDLIHGPKAAPAPVAEAPEIPLEAETQSQARSLLRADAATKADAMRAAVAQLQDGRPVDVLPVVNMRQLQLLSEESQLRQRDAALADVHGLIPQGGTEAQATLARLDEVERGIASAGTAEERRALLDRRDELLTDTTPEALRRQAAASEMLRQVAAHRAGIADRLAQIAQQRTMGEANIALSPLPKLANGQAQLYRYGFSQGIPDGELRRVTEDIYGPKGAEIAEAVAPGAAEKATGNAPNAASEMTTAPAPKALGAAVAEAGDPEMAETEAALSPEARDGMTDEERAELEAADKGMTDAEGHASAYQEAATCLKAAE